MTTIDKVLPRRSDLSTFLVHLTRSNKRQTAKEVLRTIIEDSRLVAGSPFGHAHSKMTAAGGLLPIRSVFVLRKCLWSIFACLRNG